MATVVKSALNSAFDSFKAEPEHLSWSADYARWKGSLICELEPTHLLPVLEDGSPLDIRAAWVEERHLQTHRFVWLPAIERLGGVNVCVLLGHGLEPELVPPPPFVRSSNVASGKLKVDCYRADQWEGRPLTFGVRKDFRSPVTGELRLGVKR